MNVDATTDRPTSAPFRPAAILHGLGWDVGLPLVAYYGLHLLGVGDWPALLAATVLAGLRIGWGALRDRRLNPFATVMLVVFGMGVLLALVSGDARFLLLKNSIVTAAVGLVFLATTFLGRPLTLSAAQSFQPDRRDEIEEAYRTTPDVRRGHRICSLVWGSGLVLEALVRVPLVYTLPISVMVGISEAMSVVTFAALIGWTVRYGRRARARRP